MTAALATKAQCVAKRVHQARGSGGIYKRSGIAASAAARVTWQHAGAGAKIKISMTKSGGMAAASCAAAASRIAAAADGAAAALARRQHRHAASKIEA